MADFAAELDVTGAAEDSQDGTSVTGASAAAAETVATSMQASRFMTAPATMDLMDEDVVADAVEESKIPADGDSDDESPAVDDLADSVRERLSVAHEDSYVDLVDTDGNAVPLALNLPGAPPGWLPRARQADKGEPAFADVDNPGKWPEFVYRPAFNARTKKYVKHVLPTGATPVPKNDQGKRICNGWEFHYRGWDKSEDESIPEDCRNSFRPEPTPGYRKGSLDADVLRRLGLTKQRMVDADALFFLQLILPICNPAYSGIDNDPRQPFYTEVLRFSNLYAFQNDLGTGPYGHHFDQLHLEELLRFDGAVVRNGVLGNNDSAFYHRWLKGSSVYDSETDTAITHRRWLQIKRVYKLCNNADVPKRGEPGYDPAYKYDMLWKTIVHNVNALTAVAALDLTGDETTFGHEGYGEAGSGLLGRLLGKLVTKGGQTVVVSDSYRLRPCAYSHRHKLHPPCNGWNSGAQGPQEARRIAEMIKPMCDTEPEVAGIKQIFPSYPHFTWDNYFSGDHIMDWLGENGFGAIMTCRRDRLPQGVKGEYLQKDGTPVDKRSKAARFTQPIVMVKPVHTESTKRNYVRTHVTFQSTSSCNLSTVNSIDNVSLQVKRKERGRGNQKRHWGIEMNSARKLYLRTYGAIDRIDHYIKNTGLYYRSWKYWHAAANHAKALAIAVAYDIYREIAEGNLDPLWEVDNPVDYWTFRDKLSLGMLHYSPKNRQYPGDSKMRIATQQHASNRSVASSASSRSSPANSVERLDNVSAWQILDASTTSSAGRARLCGNLDEFTKHFGSLKTGKKHSVNCVVCGVPASASCGICKVPLHHPASNRATKNSPPPHSNCFVDYHNTQFYGLAKCDCKLIPVGDISKRKANWTYPNQRKKVLQSKYIQRLLEAPPPSLEDTTDSAAV